MNGREYAAILNHPPNGSMRANRTSFRSHSKNDQYRFANGNKNPEEIIAEVKEGYYIVNHRIPSIK